MVESVNSMVKSWETIIENGGGESEINVDGYFRAMSADIISKACFGSNFNEGKEIFQKLRALQIIMSKASIGIPGFRYICRQFDSLTSRNIVHVNYGCLLSYV